MIDHFYWHHKNTEVFFSQLAGQVPHQSSDFLLFNNNVFPLSDLAIFKIYNIWVPYDRSARFMFDWLIIIIIMIEWCFELCFWWQSALRFYRKKSRWLREMLVKIWIIHNNSYIHKNIFCTRINETNFQVWMILLISN